MLKSVKKILAPNSRTDSPIEEMLYEELKKYGLNPVAGYDVFPFFIDLAFPEIKLAIEADGKAFHSTPERRRRDVYRQRKLEKIGWRFERFTGSFIFHHKEMIAATIALKYFRNNLTPECEKMAIGRVVAFFTKKDPRFAEKLVVSSLLNHEEK